MKADLFWHCEAVCLDHLGRPWVEIDPVASRFEASVNQAKQLTLAGWCHSWRKAINLLYEGTSKESRDLWKLVRSKQRNFFPYKSLTCFCPGGSCKEETPREVKISSVTSFSCVSFFLFQVHSILHFQDLSPESWKQRSLGIHEIFTIIFLSAREVWDISIGN